MRIAITLGDPNGIGPEIAVKAAQRFAGHNKIETVLVGDGHVIEDTARRLGINVPTFVDSPTLDRAGYAPGTLDPRAGKATVGYAAAAVKLALAGQVDAVIGCPHSETAVNRAGIAFSGYPGLVADLTRTPRDRAFMMLAAQGLRIAHATLHESVSTALKRLSPELVVALAEATLVTASQLGIAQPTIGLFGINPHAGEDGLFGDEDERITKPAAGRLRRDGVAIDGPVGADLLLSQRRHDFYLAMFHDQGHIPIKLISPLRASAMTIGVPILFASVAHGCAFDIAGQGVADPTGVIETIELLAGNVPLST
jgi:4-hydroxy-L-threonine phosphate dehydrogenase PdxA